MNERIEMWLFNHLRRPIFGHMITSIRVGRVGFGYTTEEVDYRHWLSKDYSLRLGLVVIEGWIP